MISSNKNRHLIIGGYDVSRYMLSSNIPYGTYRKPEWGDLPVDSQLDVSCINTAGIFSSLSAIGMLRGIDYKSAPIEIRTIEGGIKYIEWSGIIDQITEDHKSQTVSIKGTSKLSQTLNSPALLSFNAADPVTLSRNIFEQFGIAVDDGAYNSAINQLGGLVTVKISPNFLESQLTLMEMQKLLSIAASGRIYTTNNGMAMQVFSAATPTITTSIFDRDIMEHPIITSMDDSVSPYSVAWQGGEAKSVDYITGGQSQSLDFGPNSPVKILDNGSAIFVADQWESISKRKIRQVSLAIKNSIGRSLNLNSWIKMTWKKGGFDAIPLEIIGIDYTDPRYTKLDGRYSFGK